MLLSYSGVEELIDQGDLAGARILLLEETSGDLSYSWPLYRLAWVCNRLELPDEALAPAHAAWNLDPANEWYLAEYLKALRDLGEFGEVLSCSLFVRGGGVCRYYLASAEIRCLPPPWTSLEYLRSSSISSNDSVAADASIWLSMLLRDQLDSDSLFLLCAQAVDRSPETVFYRCVLADHLAGHGMIDQAREHLHHARLQGETGYHYWMSLSRLARAEEDAEREIWALRRARQRRQCPESSRNLGWALYLDGRESFREGELVISAQRLNEAADLMDSTEIFVVKADSLLELINEFESAADRYR